MKLLAICLLFVCMFSLKGIAQKYSSENARAIAAYEDALRNFQYRYYDKAEASLLEAIKRDKDFIEAYYLLAGVYTETKDIEKALSTLATTVELFGTKQVWAYYHLAFEQVEHGRFEEAQQNLEYLNTRISELTERQKQQFERLYQRASIALEIKKNPVEFNPINLGTNVNSEYDDYHPTITVDDEVLIFTSRVPHPQARTNQEDLFFCVRVGDAWTPRQAIGPPINTPANQGAQSISADGTRMIFTACNMPDGFGSCDIYITEFYGGQWTVPKNIGPPINTVHWESQPSLSADGRTMYFVSNRPGGLGKKDIWMSTQAESGQWTNPVNLGQPINTPGDDESPFIHQDGVTLYFASDGHPGLGKSDLFKTTRQPDNTWTIPENLGFPINTHAEELRIITNAQGNIAYFSSDRYGTLGGQDIYLFDMPEHLRPNPVTYVKGEVADVQTKRRLGADIELYEIGTGELFYKTKAERTNGSFTVPFVEDMDYVLRIWHQGYLFYSEHVNLLNIEKNLQVELQPLILGSAVVLKNVFFDVDSDYLRPESKTELDIIVTFMKQNPNLEFEIGGHTDNTGTRARNIELSTKRAKAVFEYLTTHGVPAHQLSYKGYADTKPVAPNTSDENKAKNRRTELIITKH